MLPIFGGAVERHEHLDDGDPVMEGLQRLLALTKRSDHVSDFEVYP